MTPESIQEVLYLADAGEHQKIIDICLRIVTVSVNDADAWEFLGHAYRSVYMLDEAFEAYSKCLSLNPENYYPYCSIGIVLREMGDEYADVKLLTNAIRLLNIATEICKDDIDVYIEYARAQFSYGELSGDEDSIKSAIKQIEMALYMDVNSLEAYHYKAYFLIKIGEFKSDVSKIREGISCLDKIIELNQENKVAYVNKAVAYQHIMNITGDPDMGDLAIAIANEALRSAPDDIELYFLKADILHRQGELFDAVKPLVLAISEFEKCAELDKDNTMYLQKIGTCKGLIAKITNQHVFAKQAIGYFSKSLSLDDTDPDTMHNYAYTLQIIAIHEKSIDKGFEALAMVNKCLQIQATWQAHELRGTLYSFLGLTINKISYLFEAEDEYERAISIDNCRGSLYKNLASNRISIQTVIGENQLEIVLPNIYRVLYLSYRIEPFFFLKYLIENTSVPHLINLFTKTFPELVVSERTGEDIAAAQQIYLNHRNRLVKIYHELRSDLSGRELINRYYLAKAISEYLGGNPIASFQLHNNEIDTHWPENLEHQYYYCRSATEILHPDAGKILKWATGEADRVEALDNAAPNQLYYAGSLLMLNARYAEAANIFENLLNVEDMSKAWYRLIECYYEQQETEKVNKTAETIFDKGVWTATNTDEIHLTALAELEAEKTAGEISRGWLIVGLVIDNDEQELIKRNLPLERSKFHEKPTVLKKEWPEPDVAELLNFDPERMARSENICRQRMPRLFKQYQATETVDAEKLSEHLFAEMLAEYTKSGRATLADYAEFVTYLHGLGKISHADFFVIVTYLTLKSKALKMDKGRGFALFTPKHLLRQIVDLTINAVGGSMAKVPVKILIKLLIDNPDTEEIKNMNFRYLQSNYYRLASYSSSELLQSINESDMLDSLSDWAEEWE